MVLEQFTQYIGLLGPVIYPWLFVFSIFIVMWIRRLATKADEETIMIKDYNVKVAGLPSDVTADEVKQYFELKWGAVVRVDLAHRCHEVIRQILRFARETTSSPSRRGKWLGCSLWLCH